ncbi:MAG: hypothetical protein KDK50_03790, partial [Chlamydiia bacterium]|nr:hypothetical protein [Chlamydiia bacterium]
KITNYINMKSAYEALEAVRGRMPSTETAKSWVVEPIKSAWSKPTGKAVFIAAGAMATLAIALIAFKSINKLMQKKVERDQPIQNKDAQQADEKALERKTILSSLGVDLLDVLTYKFKGNIPAIFDMADEEQSQSSMLSLEDCVVRYKELKTEHDASKFKNERFEIQSRLVVLQELIIKKYNELNLSLG